MIDEEENPEIENTDDGNTRGLSLGSRKVKLIAAVVVLGVVALGTAIFWLFRGGSGGTLVSAPRTVSFDDDSSTSPQQPGEQNLTIEPDQVDKIGLRIEAAGETLSSEIESVAATGVIQPNAYKSTPVISLLGGVVRKANVKLGQNVHKGQTLAVIFSDELAASQSRYLVLRTEAETARQNYDRTARLVKISPVSNSELDQALAALKTAEAELVEHHKHHERTGKLLAIGAVSREESEQAESKLAAAEANAGEARQRYERAIKVAKINPVSRGEFEQAAVRRQSAESDLAVARQRLLLLGLPPERVDRLLSSSQITSEISVLAPVSGTITKRDMNPGEVVEANKELMIVTDLTNVWAIAQVYEKDLALVRTGSGANITTDSYPGRIFRGHVTYIDPNIAQETRTVQVRVELENPEATLKIGMYVNVAFGSVGATERTVPTIPSSAVQNLNDKRLVFVATDQANVFAVKPVRLGKEENGKFSVLEGLNVGDRVVTEGSFLLRAELVKQDPTHH